MARFAHANCSDPFATTSSTTMIIPTFMGGHHFTNIVLHTIAVVLLFLVF